MPGTALDAELVFWPGAVRQRALLKAQYGVRQISVAGGPTCELGATVIALGAGHHRRALDDRRKEVREVAVDLAASLPDSRLYRGGDQRHGPLTG